MHTREPIPLLKHPGMGRSIPDGWHPLLVIYLQKISAHIKSKWAHRFPPQVIDIKEKRGSLRVTLDAYDEKLISLTQELEDLSSKTCIYCSEPGHPLRNFELPLCANCMENEDD